MFDTHYFVKILEQRPLSHARCESFCVKMFVVHSFATASFYKWNNECQLLHAILIYSLILNFTFPRDWGGFAGIRINTFCSIYSLIHGVKDI